MDSFRDTKDYVVLFGGLTVEDVSIEQGSGDYSTDTIISISDTSEFLAVLSDIDSDLITSADFIVI